MWFTVLLMLIGCKRTEVILINDDSQPVHLWIDSQESIGASNKVEPGSSRSATAKKGDAGESISINAGRDGQVIEQITCTVREEDDDDDSQTITVTYSAGGFGPCQYGG